MKASMSASKSRRGVKIIFYLILGMIYLLGILIVSGKPFPPSEEQEFRARLKNDSTSSPSSSSSSFQSTKSANGQQLQIGDVKLEQCPEIAVALLVDVSGSMILPPEKLKGLKVALYSISQYLSGDSLIALYTFSGPDDKVQNPPQERIPFSKYGEVSKLYKSTVNSLTARGSTYTRNALMFVEPKLLAAKNEYPEYKGMVLILFTDGIPYIYPPKPSCDIKNPQSCFSPEQDPTELPDIAQQIKDSGVTIYTVAFNGDLDKSSSDKLEVMLKKIASSPKQYYSAQKSDDLSGIFKEIGEKLCQ